MGFRDLRSSGASSGASTFPPSLCLPVPQCLLAIPGRCKKYIPISYASLEECLDQTYIRTCMHACIHTYTYIQIHTHTYIHTHVYTYIPAYIRIHAYIHPSMQTNAHANTVDTWNIILSPFLGLQCHTRYVCMYVCLYACVNLCMVCLHATD
jgi:hypothetical protein